MLGNNTNTRILDTLWYNERFAFKDFKRMSLQKFIASAIMDLFILYVFLVRGNENNGV